MKNAKGKQLINAVYFNNKEQVIRLLSEGVDANFVDVTGFNALSSAIFHERFELAKILIPYTDVNQPNRFGNTVLHLAAGKNCTKDLLPALLAKGAIVNYANNNGETPLYTALRKSRTQNVKFLLANGANLNVVVKYDESVDLHNITPLHYAAILGDLDMISLFAENGANVGARAEEGETARDIFARNCKKRGAEFDAIVTAAIVKFASKAPSILKAVEREEGVGDCNSVEEGSSVSYKSTCTDAHSIKKRKLGSNNYDSMKSQSLGR